MSGTLIAHVDSFTATRDEVNAVTTPQGDRTYTPVPYHRYLDTLSNIVRQRGLSITKERYALAPEGKKMFFVWDLRNGCGADDYSLAVGGRSSHGRLVGAQAVGLAMAAGESVFCCDNWSLDGEVKCMVPHRGYIDDLMRRIEWKMGRTFDRVYAYGKVLDQRIAQWKQSTISDNYARALVVRACEAGVIPTSKIMPVVDEYFEPKHKEFAPRTLWSLRNAFTEVQKTRSAEAHFMSTQKLSPVLMAERN